MDMIKNSARMKSIDAASSSEHLSVAILLITHSGIGYEMMNVVFTTFSEKAPTLNIHHLPIQPEQDPDDMIHQAKQLIKTIDTGAGVLILTDVLGATPSNIAQQLLRMADHSIRAVSGVNLPMLFRAINYSALSLDEIAYKAFSGGREGVLESEITNIQNA